jgi:hypothetical protein
MRTQQKAHADVADGSDCCVASEDRYYQTLPREAHPGKEEEGSSGITYAHRGAATDESPEPIRESRWVDLAAWSTRGKAA